MNAERPRYYHRDGTPIVAGDGFDDMLEWATEYEETEQRSVAFDINPLWRDEISTVFLGLDHNFTEIGPPLIFETIVFHHGAICFHARTSTEDEALHAHEHARALCWCPLWLRKRIYSGWCR